MSFYVTILREMEEFTIPNLRVNSIWKKKKIETKKVYSLSFIIKWIFCHREKFSNKIEKIYTIIIL